VMRKVLQMACLAACLTPAWARTTLESSVIRQPSTVFIVGPGTVVSVHLLDMPFIGPHYVVKYKTDDGELIEVWHPGKDIPVLEGMHGMLTYSTHPEMVRSFRVVTQTLPK
jgi:hypothetical protein